LNAIDPVAEAEAPLVARRGRISAHAAWRNPGVLFGVGVLVLVVLAAVLAPYLWTGDPILIRPRFRLRGPSDAAWLGTDQFGRDVYSRVLYGAPRVPVHRLSRWQRIAVTIGLAIGLVAGYVRVIDTIVMRIMDGIMAIPSILLAIAMVTLSGAGVATVIVAITIPEIPRIARLVRSVVLTVREEPYVEAAIGVGTPLPVLLVRHILPNTLAPLIVQATYVCAAAILTEAILSFLGAGIPTEVPSWGNIMAEGRQSFQIAPWVILFPGCASPSRCSPSTSSATACVTPSIRASPKASGASSERRRPGPLRARPHGRTAARRRPPHAIENVSLEVRPREIVCVVGESGRASPSPPSRSWAFLPPVLKPRGGSILLQGEELLGATRARLRELRGSRMAMVFQEPMTALNPVLPVGDQIAEALSGTPAGFRRRRSATACASSSPTCACPSPSA
jgi:peptide/nickel transport system permease protein